MKPITTIQFFCRPDVDSRETNSSGSWKNRILKWISDEGLPIKEVSDNPEALICLGGDGTILGAARDHFQAGSVIMALNLGSVGFLASIRNPDDFFQGLARFFSGDYTLKERMKLDTKVLRKNEEVFVSSALNDIVVQNPLSVVELEIYLDDHKYQTSRGTGVLISTATGSTAYNLSAHGPILMPNIKGMIITKLLDHGIPTPSLVAKYTTSIKIVVCPFRKRGLLNVAENGKSADVIVMADGQELFALEEGDEIIISNSEHLIPFVELEDNYFFKSLSEKFEI